MPQVAPASWLLSARQRNYRVYVSKLAARGFLRCVAGSFEQVAGLRHVLGLACQWRTGCHQICRGLSVSPFHTEECACGPGPRIRKYKHRFPKSCGPIRPSTSQGTCPEACALADVAGCNGLGWCSLLAVSHRSRKGRLSFALGCTVRYLAPARLSESRGTTGWNLRRGLLNNVCSSAVPRRLLLSKCVEKGHSISRSYQCIIWGFHKVRAPI